jgi:diguanylate cyclase (GGDEF)-like protein
MSDTLLEDLRSRFRETARIRLDEVGELLGRAPTSEAVQKLARHFHFMAGMGGTYGYGRVSTLGDEAEESILPLVKKGQLPDAVTFARWRELVEGMRAELLRPAKGPAVKPAAPLEFEVLLVESDDALAAAILDSLQREEMRVRRCSPEDALAVLQGRLPDAAIVNAAIAGPFLEALRHVPDGDSVGTIVIGGAAEFVDKVRAIRNGAHAFIASPVDLAALERRVTALRERLHHPARRILAVEDDPTTGTLLRGILKTGGYEVEVVRDPAEFEQRMLAFDPHLVLMDVQLNDEVSGHDLVRYLRQSERFSTIPVIIVTSDTERRAVLDGARAGADVLVAKPVDWDLLLSQIAARLERAAAVRELTDRDPLTGVLTRGAFEARARQRAPGVPAVLALLDLDRFKEVNDTHGHIAGDRVLAALGTLLRRRLRQSDVVARYGGEEFALLLEHTTVEDVVHVCEGLLEEFSRIDHGDAVRVTFSAGVTSLGESFDTAFRLADAALYEAKRSGRARVVMA